MRSQRANSITWTIAVGVFSLLVYLGHHLFGPHGALGFGALFGVTVVASAAIVIRWGESEKWERLMSVAVIALAATSGLSLTSYYYDIGLDHARERMRDADRLQSEFRLDPRFTNVFISYNGPPRHSDEWLSVGGSVPTMADLLTLQGLVDFDENCVVDWSVSVASEREDMLAEHDL